MIRYLTILLLCLPLNAATYYVDSTGDNGNTGGAGDPWLTIQYAEGQVAAGDTVNVGTNDFNEVVTISGTPGSAGNQITIQAWGSLYSATNSVFLVNEPHWTIKGFHLTGVGASVYSATLRMGGSSNGSQSISNRFAHSASAPTNLYGLYVASGVVGLTPSNCIVTGNTFLDLTYHAAVLHGQGHLVSDNYFSSQKGWDAIDLLSSNSKISGNTFYQFQNLTNSNHADLLQAWDTGGQISTNNIVEQNFAFECFGAQLGIWENNGNPTNNNGVSHWKFRNNVWNSYGLSAQIIAPNFSFHNDIFYKCTTNAGHTIFLRYLPLSKGTADNADIRNCIFYQCGSSPSTTTYGWYSIEAGVTNITTDYNLVVGLAPGQTKTGFAESNGINGSDPLFVNGGGDAATDYALTAGSPAIDTGVDLSAFFTNDYSGTTRTVPWEMGAFDFGAAVEVASLVPRSILFLRKKSTASSTLLTSLVSYWKLDESSGTRADAHGSNDLTDNNTVTATTGVLNNAAEFVRANVEYLDNTSITSDLEVGDRDWSLSFWIYPQSVATIQRLFQWDTTYDFLVRYLTTQKIQILVGGGSTYSTTATFSTSTWAHVVITFRASDNQYAIIKNDGTPETTTAPGATPAGSTIFYIGGTADRPDALVDEVGFWEKILSAAEITELYGSGTPPAYPF